MLEIQKEAAQDSFVESNTLYNNALMVQEIGQATSSILDIDRLLKTVAGVMEKRLGFRSRHDHAGPQRNKLTAI